MIGPMEATRVLLIRHGETDWNRANLIQGQIDIPLNAHGREQARLAAMALGARGPVHRIYSSDLTRALETAQAVARATKAPLIATADLRERRFGVFEGRTFDDICTGEPDAADRWLRRDPTWAPPDGETLLEFRDRVLRAAIGFARANSGEHIVIVAHGGVLDLLYRAATGLDLKEPRTWKIPNASLNRVLWTADSGFTLVGWADTSHLDAPLDEHTA